MDDDFAVLDPLDLEAEAGEEEMVAGRQGRGKALLDRAEPAPAAEADGQQRLLDDDAGIHPVLGGDRRPGDPPAPVGLADQPAEAVVGFQRIAAGGDEAEHFLERLVLKPGIGSGGAHFGEHRCFVERRGAGDGEDMLGKHVERAGAEGLGIELAVVDRVERGAGLEIFEAVAGHDDALARLVEPVVGAADPLQQPRAALGRAHLHDQVDVAPVDAEVEAGGGDQPAQLARPPSPPRPCAAPPAPGCRGGCRSAATCR